jgi:NADH:ubiquinone oxidoreductase subunit 4 (subunit M)
MFYEQAQFLLWLANPILLLCSIPLITSILLVFIPNKHYAFIRVSALGSSGLTLLWSQYAVFDGNPGLSIFPWIEGQVHISFAVGVDGISLFFIWLTALVFPFCFLSVYKKTVDLKFFCCCLLVLESFLLFAFSSADLFFFYIFFEAVLIPMFFIIGIWGSGSARVKAAYYFFFYTLAGSVFFLLAIFILYAVTGTTLFYVVLNSDYLD